MFSTRGTMKWTAVALLVVGGGVAYLYWAPRSEPGMVPWRQGAASTPSFPVAPQPPIPGVRGMPAMPGMPLRGARTMGIVDLNSATLSQLQTLPGMTPDYAQKILASRPFHGRADLERAGIPRDVFDRMSPPAMISWTVVDVDLNTATLPQLQTLPGMTADYARKILASRPFRSRADLERAGIPADVFERMSPPAMIKFVETEGASAVPKPEAPPVNPPGAKP